MKKKTKIVATLSDVRCSEDFLRGIFNRGVNVARLNSAHLTIEKAKVMIHAIREATPSMAILIDTKGPEVRTSELQESEFEISLGEEIKIRGDKGEGTRPGCLQVNFSKFPTVVPSGSRILIDDGYLALDVISSSGEELVCRALNSGTIKPRKSVNVPNVEIPLPALTEKDIDFIEMSADEGVDFIAHSFVRTKEDVLAVRKIIDDKGGHCEIIAKIENSQGVENLDEILDEAYGIMVARGDLGIEIPGEEVPLIQKKMIQTCIERNAPVITATQMLESMIHAPRATRAETSDVANAILDGTDAIMLSGETAYGDYPFEAVETMTRIAIFVENHTPHDVSPPRYSGEDLQEFVVHSAAKAVNKLDIAAAVIPTRNGSTARQLSALRPGVPIYAACYDHRAVRTLALSYGVDPYPIQHSQRHKVIPEALKYLVQKDLLKLDDLVVLIMSTIGSPQFATNQLRLNTVESVLEQADNLC